MSDRHDNGEDREAKFRPRDVCVGQAPMTDRIERADVLDLCREWYPLVGGDVCDWTKFQDAIRSIQSTPAAGTVAVEASYQAIGSRRLFQADPTEIDRDMMPRYLRDDGAHHRASRAIVTAALRWT